MALRHRNPAGFCLGLISLVSTGLATSSALGAPRMPTHVACVGDSITYGYGASNQATKSYPANLQTLLGASVQVKNFGRNSATLLSAPYGDLPYEDQAEFAAASSFVSGAGASAVVDVIIMLGSNDSKNFNWAPSGKPKNDQQFLKDYRAMVEHFSALAPKPLVFLALPPATGNSPCCSIDGQVIHDEIVPLIKQLATEKDLPTIDLNTPTTGHPEYFGDGVHPTDAGYALIAGLMRDALLTDRSSGGAAGVAGAGGEGAGGASGGSAGVESAGSGGSALAGVAGLAGSPPGGAGSSYVAGAGVAAAGAAQVAGASSGGAVAGASAGGKSSPSDGSASEGCALSGRRQGPGSLFAFGGLGLGWLVARRRRARARG
ncbi:MAG TPA: GDSL-type esterase/lipase family protein [Polyangiaceae bacterium]|nr:GDSL-type esterase/lipase family protein [Polyangiaceae bacterium]